MMPVKANLGWFSCFDEVGVFCFQIRIETSGDERWHVERLAQVGATASNEGAPCPASELARDRREPDEACSLACFERAEFGHLQGEGGNVGYADNAGQDGEAIGEARVGFDNLEDCGFDCRDLPIDLFEALSILTLQQRECQNFSAVFGRGAILHQGLASDIKLLQFEQDLASGWARLQFQQCAHASQNRPIQAIGLRQLASRLSETARLARIDLDERNAGRAERALDCTMIGPSRFEHDTVCRRLREPFDQRIVASLAKRRAAPSASRQASRWSFDTATPMVSFFIFSRLCLSFGALPRVFVQAKGKDEAIKL